MTHLLDVKNLVVDFKTEGGMFRAVKGISFRVEKGETVCIVGESGSGKSMTALAIMDILPSNAVRTADHLSFVDTDLMKSRKTIENLRGLKISMIFQEPMTSLNPVFTIGDQLTTVYLQHKRATLKEARDRALYLLERVGIKNAPQRLKQYPHELSGGLRQRVMIAMALMCGPDLIIADEPTTALDVTVQAELLHLLSELQKEMGMGLILITHDLGIVSRIADQVQVMYAGEVVESGPTEEIFRSPRHPYTLALLQCLPSNKAGMKDGRLPTISELMKQQDPVAVSTDEPKMQDVSDKTAWRAATGAGVRKSHSRIGLAQTGSNVIFELKDVSKIYTMKSGFMKYNSFAAVDGISLTVRKGESLGIVGESGSGKTTLAKLMLGLIQPSKGEVYITGELIQNLDARDVAQRIQFVFQDPFSSLNPSRSVEDAVAYPLRLHGYASRPDSIRRSRQLLDMVGLPRRAYTAYPSQLSGGQRQRVVIARSLILNPEVLICDEPTSALDVSVQAQILNLLQDLKQELDLTYIFISHNLEVVQHIASKVAVVYRGNIIESGSNEEIFNKAKHPYTKRLLSSVMSVAPGAGIPVIAPLE